MKQIAKDKDAEMWLDGGVTYMLRQGIWSRLVNECYFDNEDGKKFIDEKLKQNMFTLIGKDREWEYYRRKYTKEIFVKQDFGKGVVGWIDMVVKPLDKGESDCSMNKKREHELKLMEVKCDEYRGIETCH